MPGRILRGKGNGSAASWTPTSSLCSRWGLNACACACLSAGSGETLACGTGACASLVAAHVAGLCERRAVLALRGGELDIEWRASDGHILMTGPAETVFEGEWKL